ncbi:hypothetical protein LXL04_003919, partial [Taraxacum kok-saghyz]
MARDPCLHGGKMLSLHRKIPFLVQPELFLQILVPIKLMWGLEIIVMITGSRWFLIISLVEVPPYLLISAT